MSKLTAWWIVILTGMALLLAGCSGLGGEATPTLEPLPEGAFNPVISATGQVVPHRQAVLSAAAAGVIADVPVQLDEALLAGQVVLELQGNEALAAQVAAAQMELVLAAQALEDLNKDLDVHLAAARAEVVNAERAVDDAERYLRNLQTTAPQPDIDQARATVILLRDRLDKANEDFAPYENKPENNLVRAGLLSQLAQAQKEYDAAVRRLNNLQGNATGLDVKEAEAQLETAQVRLDAAQRDLALREGGADPDLVEAAQARVANAEAQKRAAEAALEDLVLTAPFDGTVSELYVNPGEWINPGQPVLLLADLGNLEIETTDLSEIDVAQIAVGDTAAVSFDAFPDFSTTGTITRIAPKAAQGSGVNYTVVLVMETLPPDLRWGMTAFVDIEPDQ